jgi:hypothetical protein
VLLVILGGIAGLNAWVDPYGRFRATARAGQHIRYVNNPLLRLMQIRQVPGWERARTDVVIVGDSRADMLTTERLTHFQGHTVLNLAHGGAGLGASLSMLEHEWPNLKSVRVIIVTTPFERMSGPDLLSYTQEAQTISDSTLRYLLSLEMLSVSYAILTRPAVVPKPPPNHNELLHNSWRGFYKAYTPERVEARLELLEGWAERARSRGAHLVLWAPPVDAATQQILREEGFEETWAQLAARLDKIGPLLDLTHASGLNGVPFHFRDAVHNYNAELILSALIAK